MVPSAGPRLLLVEDDRFLRRALEASLRGRGFIVVTAADGEIGLELAKREPFTMVLLDMLMPKMTGIEVLRALRADPGTSDLPVLVLSNSSRDGDITEARALGVTGYIVKSNVSLQEVCDHIAELVRGAS